MTVARDSTGMLLSIEDTIYEQLFCVKYVGNSVVDHDLVTQGCRD